VSLQNITKETLWIFPHSTTKTLIKILELYLCLSKLENYATSQRCHFASDTPLLALKELNNRKRIVLTTLAV